MWESTSELRDFVSLHAIEPMRPRDQQRVDGVGRPTFDFHTDPNVHILIRTRVAVDLEAELFPHVLVDGAHAFAHGCWRWGRLLRLRSVARGRASAGLPQAGQP